MTRFVSDTLFRNVRVLAIGQLIEAKDGKKLAEGNTATLELTPRQSENLALGELRWGKSLWRCAALPTSTGKERAGSRPGQAGRFHQSSQVRSEIASVWRQLGGHGACVEV